MFEKLDDVCEPVSYAEEENEHGFHDMECGNVLFSWSKKGFGFGQLYFYFKDDEEGNKVLHCSNECMSKETVKEILCSMVDNAEFDDVRDENGEWK